MKKSIIILCAWLLPVILSAQADLKKLDAYYAKALKDWNIPGMSIAIVKDGKVVFAKGYGVKEIGKPEPPDANTLFAIASNSKAFTAAAIAQLVEEGKLNWNDKVRQYVPYFELYDHWVSNETTLRDLLSHRVGLGTFSGDLIWYRSNLSAEEIIRRVKHLPKAYDFRSGYGYSNVMYITAGEVIRKVTGKYWGEVIKERFLSPLGMNRTLATPKHLDEKGNYATPHLLAEDQHRPMAWEDWGTVASTGGIISSVNDMSQWMIFNLNNGVWKGDTLFSKESRNLMWTPHNVFTVDHTGNSKATHFRGYGLGWGLNDYHGRMRVGHTGGYPGMLSAVAMIPDENLGVVILTNGMKSIFSPLVNYTIDAFLKVPERDWSAEALTNIRKNPDTRIADRKAAKISGTRPSVTQEQMIGTYRAPAYGKIVLARDGNTMKINFEHTPDLSATLKHWHHNVWELVWDKPEVLAWFSFGTVAFDVSQNNEVTRIKFDVPNDDFFFEELDALKVAK